MGKAAIELRTVLLLTAARLPAFLVAAAVRLEGSKASSEPEKGR